MLHWIFIGCALALVLLTILLLAQRLLKSDAGNVREWARIEENVEALRYEYDRAVAAKKAGRMTDEEFRERESELVLRTLDETALPDESAKAQSHTLLMATIAAIAVMVPATTTGLYLYYGDYSSLDPKAQEQIRATREAMQSQRNMFETVKRLEAGVVSQPDNLEAWEILAEHYAQTGNLAQAVVAYENVVRLKPDNAVAYGELADILVATQDGDLSGKVAEYVFKALELDPYQMKSLLLGGAVAFDQGDYAKAAILWNRFRQMVPPEDEIYATLTSNIEMALRNGNLKEIPQDPVPPPPADPMGMMGAGTPMGGNPDARRGRCAAHGRDDAQALIDHPIDEAEVPWRSFRFFPTGSIDWGEKRRSTILQPMRNALFSVRRRS